MGQENQFYEPKDERDVILTGECVINYSGVLADNSVSQWESIVGDTNTLPSKGVTKNLKQES